MPSPRRVAFSPDGRFLAYVSDESGRAEVFIRTFPASPLKWQVSASGGAFPVWRSDGRELRFLANLLIDQPEPSPIVLQTGARP